MVQETKGENLELLFEKKNNTLLNLAFVRPKVLQIFW